MLKLSCLFLQIESLTLTFHGHELIVDSSLELNYGRYDELWNWVGFAFSGCDWITLLTMTFSFI